MLHLIFQSPIATAILERIAAGDDVVFLENAVLRLLHKGSFSDVLAQLLLQNRLYVLAEDLEVRGIGADELVNGITVIDYAGLVGLTVSNPSILSWS
jgi:tRNA 2-thiouridine synthesizing protein B